MAWRGRIEVFPLLALPFAFGLKIVAPSFGPRDKYVTETHTLPRDTAANDSGMQSFCQSFIPPSADVEPTARKFFGTAVDL